MYNNNSKPVLKNFTAGFYLNRSEFLSSLESTVAQKYGGPKGPTQTKKENANKKEHIIKEIKKTQTKKNTLPNKKRKRTQKSTTQAKKYKTQTKKHNANRNTQRKQKKHNVNKKAQRKQKSKTQTKNPTQTTPIACQ